MLASSKELDLNDDHTGLLELDEAEPGTDFADFYGLNDYIIDIENKMFTHRPDCFGVIGVAREIAGIQQQPFTSPEWYLNQPSFNDGESLPLTINNQLPELVPRFMAVAMKDVSVGPSSLQLQIMLTKVGLKPINNIVDMTNYLMYLTGQPLHAYDYDKVASRSSDGAVIVVRHLEEGEKVSLLNGKTIEPRSEAIMIATDKELIGIGGVMGGADTEIDDSTKNIIIECANFDMYSIRRTSMAHGLFTDAVTRFNKGQSVQQCDRILAQAMEMSSGSQASPVLDPGYKPVETTPVTVSLEFINKRLGLELDAPRVTELLSNVECRVEGDVDFVVYPPFWRTDLDIPEDIVEEVGRLNGFHTLPLDLPKRSITPTPLDDDLHFKRKVRSSLAKLGANEVLTYSFVHAKLLESVNQNPEMAFKLSNALSPELQYYRMSLTPSLLQLVNPNIRSGFEKFVLFELGKSHNKHHQSDDDGVPKEYSMLSIVYADSSKTAGPGYYGVRTYLDALAKSLGFAIEYRPIEKEAEYPVTQPFDHARSALVFAKGTDIALGMIGEFKASVRKRHKLPVSTAGFEVGLHELMAASNDGRKYRPLSRFPGLSHDICLQVDGTLSYADLSKSVEVAVADQIKEDQSSDIWPIDIYSSDELNGKKRITFRVKLVSHERTLTEEILTGMLDAVSSSLQNELGAERI
jgi:phenylalanyl-tRNA synthetase beta chain